MIDDYLRGIALGGLERRISNARDGMARIEKDAAKYVENAAYKIQRAAEQRHGDQPPRHVNQQSFEAIATRLAKFAENGFTTSDVLRYGVPNAEQILDSGEVSEEAKMEILMKAASALVTQGAPNPESTLSLLFD
jgi:hypothetical protein